LSVEVGKYGRIVLPNVAGASNRNVFERV
jgi:hypothetical protein